MTAADVNEHMKRIAFVGTYVPRQCGIATFTNDLCEALGAMSLTRLVVPINDSPAGYDYSPTVRFTVDQNDLSSYRRAAQFLNINRVDAVSLQHEFGIFGGPAGSHVLALLAELRTPVVTTLHTVLSEPTAEQREVMKHLTRLSDRLVVMSRRGEEFLRDVYHVQPEKIDFIPHGIPDISFVDPSFYKDQFGVVGKSVILTFGLLGPSKGLESAIRALPAITKRFPDVVYLVVGATHPHVRREQGETYRAGLRRLARDLGVKDNVIFHNRYVETQELIEFIGAADLYFTPYLNEVQITSGTLAWAVGAGKAVVSTPYWHARELLADGRGVLVPFNDSEALAAAAISLLENESERQAMRKRAYMYARDMIWPKVGRAYLEAFERARAQRAERPRSTLGLPGRERLGDELPAVGLQHLHRLTDDTGLLQHAVFTVPSYVAGYCTDDNARALVLTVLLDELGESSADEIEDFATRYLAFLAYSFNTAAGRFRNFLGYAPRTWLEEIGSEDCHAQALWALGTLAGRARHWGMRAYGVHLFPTALSATTSFTSPRAWANTLLGIYEYRRWVSGDHAVQEVAKQLAERLVRSHADVQGPDWQWFEDRLTYANARLPHGLLAAGLAMSERSWIDLGLHTLDWLVGVQRPDGGHFVPIGSNGFFVRGQERARFDQQPVEAYTTVSACLEAFRITGDGRWHDEATRAFEWFLGRNDLGLPLCNPRTGGCHDGLHTDRVNANRGAESTLAYLLALVEMRLAEQPIVVTPKVEADGSFAPITMRERDARQPA